MRRHELGRFDLLATNMRATERRRHHAWQQWLWECLWRIDLRFWTDDLLP